MKRWMQALAAGAALISLGIGAFALHLTRPLPVPPQPADLHCYELSAGHFVELEQPTQAFGIGLSYAAHIEETAASFDPGSLAPVFVKHPSSSARDGAELPFPTTQQLIATAEAFEPGLGAELEQRHGDLDPLLDYEVELGIVLLEDIDPAALEDPGFAPPLGFFVANDLSARSLALLGEGRDDRYAYWGISKSFPGFMPIAAQAFVPDTPHADGAVCTTLETRVNGELRQQQSTRDLVYTPKTMLSFVHASFPEAPLSKGTVILTGTPGGVVIGTPRWLVRLGGILGMDRFDKLAAKHRDRAAFLRPGDAITVRAEGLGELHTKISG